MVCNIFPSFRNESLQKQEMESSSNLNPKMSPRKNDKSSMISYLLSLNSRTLCSKCWKGIIHILHNQIIIGSKNNKNFKKLTKVANFLWFSKRADASVGRILKYLLASKFVSLVIMKYTQFALKQLMCRSLNCWLLNSRKKVYSRTSNMGQ